MNHDDIIELLGAYAIDALEPDEAEVVRRHLDECPRCAEEVAQHHQVAALLGNAGGEAPAHLWSEIAGKIDGTGRVRAVPSPDRGPGRSRAARGIGRVVRRPWTYAAAAAVVAIALLSLQTVHLNNRVSALSSNAAQQGIAQQAQRALSDPNAQTVALRGPSGSGATRAEIVVLPSGTAYLLNQTLPALPASETYQLWGRSSSTLISLGVLGNHPKTVALTIGGTPSYGAYLVTAEPAGGVVRTTHRPVATSGVLSA
ncbi:MAG: anti-sigma factor domain-containing protein [Acidimicrobiales bacterium]